MSTRRPLLGTVAVAAVTALTLAACGSGSGSSASGTGPAPTGSVAQAADLSTCKPDGVTLKLNFGPQGAPAVKLAVAAMQQKYPGLKFDATASATASYNDLTKQVVSDAAVGKPDDLISTGLSQLTFWVDSYHPAEIDQSKLPAGYQKQFLAAGTDHGKVYIAPFQVSAPVLLVNQTALKNAGIDPSVPITSYADLVKDAQTLTARTGKPSISISTDGLPDWFGQGFVQSAGGTFVNADGSAGFGDATGVKALSIWSTLAKNKTLLNVGGTDAMAQFQAGNLPFMVYTTSIVATIQKGVGSKFQWMPVDLPTLGGTDAGPLPAGGNGWLVLSQDPCKAAYANAMISIMLSKEISLAASGTGFSYIPVNKDAATELLAGSTATPQLKYAWSYNKPLSAWGGFKGSVTKQIFDALTTTTQQLSTGADPQATVASAVRQVNELVGK
ncbi:extracellular solute-binding protein [Frankia sp. AgPm24]|uniref:extracellular solute-binding protein n=1 Tax=Frankia sp. AgPm24 TaxID=631128 RepID=UPI00201065BB|nr:extracellular solute-binding protein [Frankia sp. AgPm24]MCK9921565.1 extracellular solute-binding protein [Frankia sp. AgPm24]